MSAAAGDHAGRAGLLVLSHLRWDWVWQRPQHLVSRLAANRPVWYAEEPVASPNCRRPRIVARPAGAVVRVWLEVPGTGAVHYGDPPAEDYARLLAEWVEARNPVVDAWLYTPMAFDIAEALTPRTVVYDVMDDLSAFADAPPGIQLRQRRLLDRADLVFAGGRTLHRGVAAHRPRRTHLFPSGVETAHYARSRVLREPHDRPVAGYVGVIDERMDLRLLADLADGLPDWEIRMAGPVTKIDPSTLPRRPNLVYLGMQPYEELPRVMADFDVALMPFALNAATRSISPTKTLEYLAAGLPVVSTRIADVVADFGEVVHFADSGADFAHACRHVLTHCRDARDQKLAPIQRRHEWDFIAAAMERLLDEAAEAPGAVAASREEPA